MFCRLSTLTTMKVGYGSSLVPQFSGVSLTEKLINSFTKQTKSSKIWMQEHVSDEFVKKAQKDNYRSRASYKLIEIQERYKIFKQGYKVLELGSAPGGWTQVAVEFTKSTPKNPTVLAIDRDHMDSVSGAEFFEGDINEKKTQVHIPEFFKLSPVDVVIADMAPNFCGDLDMDHLQIMDLNKMTIDVCTKNLKIGGTVVMKTLSGTMEKDAYRMFKVYFKEFLRVKPRASRPRSSELYYLGKGYGLSKEYEMFKKIEEKKEKGQTIEDSDIPDLGFTDEELIQQTRAVVLQMYDQGKTLSEAEINELKQIPELGIDWDKLKPRTKEEISKREATYTEAKQYNDYKKYYGNKLTFTKEKPVSLASLAKELAETEPIDINTLAAKGMLFEEIDKIRIKQKEDPIEDEGLFLNEEEDYDPYADEDEAKKLKMKFQQSKDAYDQDSAEHNPYDPENMYTADDQPRTLTDMQFKQLYSDEINAYQRMVEKKTDYIDKLESGEADVEDMDREDMEDVLDDLEDELEDEEIHRTSQEQEFNVTQKRENQFKDDHLKADDLEEVIFKKK